MSLIKEIKNTKKRLKQLWEYKSIKILFGFLAVAYFYVIGLFAQTIGRNKIGLSPFEQQSQKVSFGLFSSIFSIFTADNKGVVILFGFLLLFVCAALIHLRIQSVSNDTWDERGFNISKDGTYGTAGWMTREELDKALHVATVEETTGTIFGKLDPEPEEGFATEAYEIVSLPPESPLNKHTAVYGASGTGKSRSFVRPQIMQCAKRGESVIVTDPKGEMYEDMAVYLKNKGYKVRIFNLVDPQYSDSWNCLAEITHDPNKVELMAQTFADVIINNTANGKGDPFWDKSEMNLLKALSLYVALDEFKTPEERTIGSVYDMLIENSEEQLFAMFDKLPKHHPARQPWGIFKQGSDAVRGNTITGLGSRLQVFQSEVIRAITSVSDIDLEEIGKEKTALFVIMSDQDGTLSFISSLFFSFLFIRLVRYADNQPSRAVDVPVNFILDEFPNIGQIPDFTKKLSTIRSRELRVAVIFQNISQLQNRYPDGLWEEIIGNCDTQLFLGCVDDTTATFISERTGEITIEVKSERVNRKSLAIAERIPEYSESSSDGKRYLLTPDEVMRLNNRTALVIVRGQKILKVNKFDYSLHHDADLLVPCQITDHVPSWREGDFVPSFSVENILEQDKQAKLEREQMMKKRGELQDDSFSVEDFSSEEDYEIIDENAPSRKSKRNQILSLLNSDYKKEEIEEENIEEYSIENEKEIYYEENEEQNDTQYEEHYDNTEAKDMDDIDIDDVDIDDILNSIDLEEDEEEQDEKDGPVVFDDLPDF